MACTLIGSIPLGCLDGVGGIKELKVKVLPSLATLASDYTVSSGVVTIASGSQTGWFLYGIEKNTSHADDTPTTSRENGTTFFAQVVAWVWNKMDSTKRNELQVISQARIQIAFRDMNDNYWLAGYERGMTNAGSKGSTGTASGDRSGYEMNFEGEEAAPFLSMSAATYNDL